MRRLLPLLVLATACGDKDLDTGTLDRDGDGFTAVDDCDDMDATSNPDADEICDDVDNDCDGEVDNQPIDGDPYDRDQDQDGFGDATDPGTLHCSQPAGLTRDNTDCGDDDPLIYPGASEDCDGRDEDCDGAIDEDFDADLDGYFSMADCEEGDDCDDDDALSYPGAAEEPYDGIDQDCDGADLLDADGDGFNGYNADGNPGNDCDDTDADVNPNGTEIEFDGIDQDCDGSDDVDGDDDGFDHIDHGGDDCDDEDASVNPDALDFMNDGDDTDCDGEDGGTFYLADAEVSIKGAAGVLLGYTVNACDLDDDGLDDLVVSAPFGASYAGQIGIFLGSGSSTWSAGMQLSDADVLITGGSYEFFGFQTVCADLDGDGVDDLVTELGEIQYSVYINDFAVAVFYGGSTAWTATMTTLNADAMLNFPMGGPNQGTVFSAPIETGDLDADGQDDLVINAGHSLLSIFDGEERVLVVLGDSWSGNHDMDDLIVSSIAPPQPHQYSTTQVLQDMDGDGYADLFVGSSGWSSNYGDYDTAAAATDSSYSFDFSSEGQAHFLGDAHAAGAVELESLDYANQVGQYDQQAYGWHAIEGDFDGDGTQDLIVAMSGANEDSETAIQGAGGFYLFSNPGADLTGADLDPTATADSWGHGDLSYGYFGWELRSVGDPNGDGYDDVLVSEPCQPYTDEFQVSQVSCYGRVYLVSGQDLSGEVDNFEDVALLRWESDQETATTGSSLAVGDFDGDGVMDYVISEYNHGASTTLDGRVSVSLSTAW